MDIAFVRDAVIHLAWNSALGCQRDGATSIDPVLALHLNTFREACQAYGLPVPPAMSGVAWGAQHAPEETRW